MVGNIPNYDSIDVVRVLFQIKSPVSRYDLMKRVGLGEGTIRSILDILKKNKMITSDKKGHALSKKGSDMINQLAKTMSFPKQVFLKMYEKEKSSSLLLKNIKCKRSGCRERDIAVKNGSNGALLFKGNFIIEGYNFKELEKEYKKLNRNDLLIVCFADNYNTAERSVIAVAYALNIRLNKVICSLA